MRSASAARLPTMLPAIVAVDGPRPGPAAGVGDDVGSEEVVVDSGMMAGVSPDTCSAVEDVLVIDVLVIDVLVIDVLMINVLLVDVLLVAEVGIVTLTADSVIAGGTMIVSGLSPSVKMAACRCPSGHPSGVHGSASAQQPQNLLLSGHV